MNLDDIEQDVHYLRRQLLAPLQYARFLSLQYATHPNVVLVPTRRLSPLDHLVWKVMPFITRPRTTLVHTHLVVQCPILQGLRLVCTEDRGQRRRGTAFARGSLKDRRTPAKLRGIGVSTSIAVESIPFAPWYTTQ